MARAARITFVARIVAGVLVASVLSPACGDSDEAAKSAAGGSSPLGPAGRAGRGGGGTAGGTAGTSGEGGAGAEAGAGAGGASLRGPLRASNNPHYFADADGRALVLVGSHTWNDLQDWGTDGTLEPLDFDAYTRFLVAHGHNFTLLWRTELTKFCALPTTASTPPDFVAAPQPWARTGSGLATDGQPKFDLTAFDGEFFERLETRVSALNDAGIWVGVYFFTGEWLSAFRCTGDGYPFSGDNNVNGIDDGGGNGSMSMSSENEITAIQDAMVEHTIDVLNAYPNVLWIVSEEAASNTAWWQAHMIEHVRAYEADKPLQHPIGLAAITGAPDSDIYDSDADWVAPFAGLSPEMTCGSGTPPCKVNVNDSDHSYFGMWNESAQANREYAWKNFARGNQVAFMDPYVLYYPREGRNPCENPSHAICPAPDPRWDNFRDTLGAIVSYSRRMNLNNAHPSNTLCSTQYCLGQSPPVGTELLVYAPDGGTVSVDLRTAAGRTLDFEWFEPATNSVVEDGSVDGGELREFETPSAIEEDAVLYIVDAAGHAV